MDNQDIQQRLAAMNQAYEEAPVQTLGDLPEDGTYQAVIDRFDFFESKAGDLFLKTCMIVKHDVKYDGWSAEAIHNLTDPDRISWVKKHLLVLGYEGGLDDLVTGLESFIGLPVEITVKTSDRTNSEGEHYRNVYVNRRLGSAEQTDVPADTSGFAPVSAGVAPDDDIPF